MTAIKDLETDHFFRSSCGLAVAKASGDLPGMNEWMDELEVLALFFTSAAVGRRAAVAAAQAAEYLTALQSARIGYTGPLALVVPGHEPAANDQCCCELTPLQTIIEGTLP